MNLLTTKINFYIFVIFFLFFVSCNAEKNSVYYAKTSTDWEAYFSDISDDKDIDLENTVLLVLKSSECSPAKAELKWWDEFLSNSDEVDVKLIILEKFERTSRIFLETENISLPFYIDSSALVLERNLLPITPMKVFINKKGQVEKIAALDSREDFKDLF